MPSISPVPRLIALSILSFGIRADFAVPMAVRSRGFALGSPPPIFAAMMISLAILLNSFPRLASVAAFLCLMLAHLECPDIAGPPWLDGKLFD